MDQLLKWDEQLFLFFNKMGTEFLDPFWLAVSGTKTWIPLYILLLFLIFRKSSLKILAVAFLALIVNVILTDTGSVWLFKEQFQRLRPCHVESLLEQMRLVKEGCGGQFGFVSSHASNTFGLAVLAGGMLKDHYPKLRAILIIWAIGVAYSRIYLGVHYPLDVICGGIYGSLVGFGILKLFKSILAK